jgi:hypothetical protein
MELSDGKLINFTSDWAIMLKCLKRNTDRIYIAVCNKIIIYTQ